MLRKSQKFHFFCFQNVPDHKPPVIVPSGKNGKYFLSQEKRLGVRLRARQVRVEKNKYQKQKKKF